MTLRDYDHFARNLNLERINLHHCSVSREITKKKSKIKLTLIILISPSLPSFISLSLVFLSVYTDQPIAISKSPPTRDKLQPENKAQVRSGRGNRETTDATGNAKYFIIAIIFFFRRCLNYFNNNRERDSKSIVLCLCGQIFFTLYLLFFSSFCRA